MSALSLLVRPCCRSLSTSTSHMLSASADPSHSLRLRQRHPRRRERRGFEELQTLGAQQVVGLHQTALRGQSNIMRSKLMLPLWPWPLHLFARALEVHTTVLLHAVLQIVDIDGAIVFLVHGVGTQFIARRHRHILHLAPQILQRGTGTERASVSTGSTKSPRQSTTTRAWTLAATRR